MLNGQLLLAFAMTAIVVNVVPGPSVLFIVGRALSVSRPSAMAAAVGNTVGTVTQGLLAAIGVGSLIAESQLLFNGIKTGGAIYLVWMGATTLRGRKTQALGDESTDRGNRRGAWDGFVVGLTNPKMVIFFTAALPQFVDRERGYVTVQMLVLLALYGVLSMVNDASWTMLGGSLRTWTATNPRRIERMIGFGGACIVAVGITLALTH